MITQRTCRKWKIPLEKKSPKSNGENSPKLQISVPCRGRTRSEFWKSPELAIWKTTCFGFPLCVVENLQKRKDSSSPSNPSKSWERGITPENSNCLGIATGGVPGRGFSNSWTCCVFFAWKSVIAREFLLKIYTLLAIATSGLRTNLLFENPPVRNPPIRFSQICVWHRGSKTVKNGWWIMFRNFPEIMFSLKCKKEWRRHPNNALEPPRSSKVPQRSLEVPQKSMGALEGSQRYPERHWASEFGTVLSFTLGFRLSCTRLRITPVALHVSLYPKDPIILKILQS